VSRLTPVSPYRYLVVPCPLTGRLLSRGRRPTLFKQPGSQLFKRYPVQVESGVKIHLLGQQFIAGGSRYYFYCGHERKVRDRAITGRKDDQSRTRSNLTRNTLQIITGTVHKVKSGFAHRLSILDHTVQPDFRMLLLGRADGLKNDVIEASQAISS